MCHGFGTGEQEPKTFRCRFIISDMGGQLGIESAYLHLYNPELVTNVIILSLFFNLFILTSSYRKKKYVSLQIQFLCKSQILGITSLITSGGQVKSTR